MSLQYHKNKNGLIFKVTGKHDVGEVGNGDSICNNCLKEMKGCWHIVCSVCEKTFCYECAKDDGHYWYCKLCYSKNVKHPILNILTGMGI